MPVLTIDSATSYVTAAVVDGDRVAAARTSTGGNAAARQILHQVDAVLVAAGLSVGMLDGIAVGAGPGSFTGLRIGIATAVALGEAARVPVAAVSTLDALRSAAPAGAVAAIDARRGEVFAGGPDLAPAAYRPEDLAARLAVGALVIGDGAMRYRGILEAAGLHVPPDGDPLHAPSGAGHAALARFDGSPVRPLYLRAPDAQEPAAP